MSVRQRITAQTAYLLHYIPYRETSLIVEVFSREYGRLPLMAKGARRPRAALRGVLCAFQPLELSWQGLGEVKTLTDAYWQGGQPLLAGRALLCGYYLNELLLKLLPREDAHPQLFDIYAHTLTELAKGAPVNALLRSFELGLLRELGYALALPSKPSKEEASFCAQQIDPSGRYVYIIEHGPIPDDGHYPEAPAVRGKTLLDMAAGDFSDAATLAESKHLLRRLIGHYLGGQVLESRRIFMELQEL